MTVSATASVCHQHILSESPVSASPAMKLCQSLREPVESRHSDGPRCAAANSHRTQPTGPSALQSQGETRLPALRSGRPQERRPPQQIMGQSSSAPSAPTLCHWGTANETDPGPLHPTADIAGAVSDGTRLR